MNVLLAELKRRKVLRVAGVYVLTAWLTLQVAEILIPALQLEAWVLSLVLLMLVLGFPIALICSWAVELSPDGIRLESDQSHFVKTPALGAMAVTLAVLAGMTGVHLQVDAADPSDPALDLRAAAVAVLPFDGPGDGTAFGDGLTEELMIELSLRSGVQVVGRSSAAAFAERGADLRQVGEALDATHLIEGRVRRIGDRLRVTAQIIDARTGYQLWAQRIDTPFDKAVAGQLEIARIIAEQLATVIAQSASRKG